uniref:Osteopetrosis-associated transmembrane protein 1 n=1 Tax=Photinus pyralis TaxID=7054 RepID=A0A1Y1NJB3_PHOPY
MVIVMMKLLLICFIIVVSVCFTSTEVNEAKVNCTELNNNLANAIASFSKCAITYSRPIKLCEQCVNEYIDVSNGYQNMSASKDEDGVCLDGYIHLDNLEILETLYGNANELWNRANCDKCFQMDNGTLTNVSSVETTTFNVLFTNLTDCIKQPDVNATTVCQNCAKQYNELNKFYIAISYENRGGVCMDVVDVMNGTRGYWSSNCCKFRHRNELGFIISTVFISLLTILFYILTKVCSQKRAPVILKRK